MKHVLLLVCMTACVVGDEAAPEGDVGSLAFDGGDLFRRVVLGRMYQKADWTLPQAGTSNAERIAYVCSRIKPLKPSYVSGLLRLDDDDPLTADQIAIFTGVRDCIRNGNAKVKFDVVLNAEHYTDNTRHTSGAQALAALKARADEAKQKLGVTIIFFDFFSSPYNGSDKHAGWYKDALTRGTDYIRKTLGMRVGGNVWGLEAPPNADFVALDNFDRESTDGFEYNKLQIAAMRRLPILIHIENNPQKPQSKGLQWINGSADYRRDVLNKFANAQRPEGFAYMFPVFFPLQCCVGTTCGPTQCSVNPSDRIAYDASRDGNMLQKIDELLGK